MATSGITSPYQQGTDFASELLLNRVMNGQQEPESGKTITAANRALASKFDATSYTYGVLAENAAVGKTIVDTTQNALTELLDQVKSVGQNLTGLDGSTAQSLAGVAVNALDAILATESSAAPGKKLLQSDTFPITIGEIPTNSSDIGTVDTLTVGGININASGLALDNLRTELVGIAGGTITYDSARLAQLTSKAQDQIMGAIAREGSRQQILSNRYDLLNDLITSYHQASDDAAKQLYASDNTLLNIVS